MQFQPSQYYYSIFSRLTIDDIIKYERILPRHTYQHLLQQYKEYEIQRYKQLRNQNIRNFKRNSYVSTPSISFNNQKTNVGYLESLLLKPNSSSTNPPTNPTYSTYTPHQESLSSQRQESLSSQRQESLSTSRQESLSSQRQQPQMIIQNPPKRNVVNQHIHSINNNSLVLSNNIVDIRNEFYHIANLIDKNNMNDFNNLLTYLH